jgi:hypothetical protein
MRARGLINAIQFRQARVSVGPSTVRGQRTPGLAKAAREYLANLSLAQFGTSRAALFRSSLDRATRQLKAQLPRKGRSWGIARKVLNIFLRDAFYNHYLRKQFQLDRGEALLEIPLDSITAGHVRNGTRLGRLPRWSGVKHLKSKSSDCYQREAAAIASRKGVARVHLDAFWWAGPR